MRSPPDGYTLVMVALSSAVNATLFENLPFIFLRDIAPVGTISRNVLVMEVHPSVPAATGLELIAYAKANPNKLNMASPGSGTGPHMASELFKLMTGVRMIHVPGTIGLGVPRNTPVEIIDKLNREINAGLADPKIKARIADLGSTPLALSPGEYGKLLAEETEKWAKIIKAANIKAE